MLIVTHGSRRGLNSIGPPGLEKRYLGVALSSRTLNLAPMPLAPHPRG